MRMDNAIVAFTTDTHINSTVGLSYPTFNKDDGGTYRASKAQRWSWSCYLDYCKQLEAAKKKTGYPLFVIHGGEVADDLTHSKTQLISPNNTADILKNAALVMEPLLSLSEGWFCMRGTEAHTGASANLDEIIARDLGAIPDYDGNSSWWWYRGKLGGVTFDVAHHPGTGGKVPRSKSATAGRLASDVVSDYVDMGLPPPQLILRGHNHIFSDSGRTYSKYRAIIGTPWQLGTAFGYRIGRGSELLPIGGMYFICEKGKYTTHVCHYKAKPSRYWTVKELD
jgi:hypothetical protein